MSSRKFRQGSNVLLQTEYATPVTSTLIEELVALIERLQQRVDGLYWKCSKQTHQRHWVARGQIGAVQRVVHHLLAIRRQHTTSYALYLALKDYLGCLEKYCVDAKEEQHQPASSNVSPILQWKAIGEARELFPISRALTRITEAYAPPIVCHTLALDGYTQVPTHLFSPQAHTVVQTYSRTYEEEEVR